MLFSAADGGSLSHAYIIEGQDAAERMRLAEDLALLLFCENRKKGEKPCRICPGCGKVLGRNHPDVLYLRREKDSVGVSEVREQVVDTVDIRPYLGGRKLYILDDADRMTVQAQNSLLKTLEEPPEYAVLLLLCRDARLFADTVRSRAVTLSLRDTEEAAGEEEIARRLRGFLEGIRKEDVSGIQAFSKELLSGGKSTGLYAASAFTEYVRGLLLERAGEGPQGTEYLFRLAAAGEKAERRFAAGLPPEHILTSLLLEARDVL